MKIIRKSLSLFLIFIMILGLLAGCSTGEEKSSQGATGFEQARIGVMTGSSFDLLVSEYFPEAEKCYYMNVVDLILNLKQNRIDGVLMDAGFFTPFAWEDNGLSSIEMDMPATEYAVAFPQNAQSELLKTQMDEFIRTQTENGWLAAQKEKWISSTEPDGSLDLSKLTGENGTLRVATTVESKPFDYLKDGQYCGFDADFIFRFAEEYGYALDIDTMDFGALLANITAERYDLAIASITVTEERKESVLFPDVYFSCPIVMAVVSEEFAGAPTLADFETATIGVVTGTNYDQITQQKFPKAERMYFSSAADVLIALEQGKVDAFFADKAVCAAIRWENSAITCIDEPVEAISNALIFAKEGYDETLLGQVNDFIAQSKADGTLDRLEKKWFGVAEPDEHPDYTKLTGTNGTIRVAIGDAMKPSSYQKGLLYTGYEVDFLTLFAEAYGYQLDFHGMSFDALIPSVASGKCDIGACGITVTPERMESVTFSDIHMDTYGVAVIRNEGAASVGNNSSKKTLKDFETATLGIHSGTSFDPLARERFPNAQRQYYSMVSDMILAVEQGKIDGYISETTYVTAALWEGARIEAVEEPLDRTNAGFIFQKNSEGAKVREQLDAFIIQAKETGLLDELKTKWLGSKEPEEVFDSSVLTGENGTLKIAVSPDLKPLCYMRDGALSGYEVEVLQHFAKEYGYQLELLPMTFDAILPGVVAGKYDIGTGGVTITEERAQSVDFSESYLTVDVVMVVKAADDTTASLSFWEDVKDGFHKTFIREDRWKLIGKGLGVTILISICAAIAGSLLGFGLYMLSRSDAKPLRTLARGIAKVYSRIIAGTPVVVILMILFYVVFGNFQDMSGILVAIIGFMLTFGAFVYDHMKVSVDSVDRGQTEAAYALGYTKNKTFFRVIFPQAMSIFMPSYCGHVVELVKATAVVGYIAVNDLTKMGDIIRSNTYEAFFPLIATAVIYFLLTWLLTVLLGLVKVRFEPRRRSRDEILKGVKTE